MESEGTEVLEDTEALEINRNKTYEINNNDNNNNVPIIVLPPTPILEI